jgi:class 3 adenylate cyclase
MGVVAATAKRGKGPPGSRVVTVNLLGPFVITLCGRVAGPWPRPTAKRFCELLFLSPGRRVSRDVACEELFPGLGAHAASRALSKALSLARGVLSQLGEPTAGLLQADLGHIWASSEAAVDIDLEAHEEALRAALAIGPGQGRDDRLVAALADEEDLLADEPYAEWALRPRERLEALRQEARLALARDRARGAGRSRPEAVVEAWESCLGHDPAFEEAAAALMRAYSAQGQRHLVVRTYDRCRVALEELGLRISPALDEVHAEAIFEPAAPRVPGAPFKAPAPGPARLRQERKVVSVLFAEVAGPATLGNKLDPEDLCEVVGGALARVIAEVEGLGGTVTSVSGGGLAALFGAPEAHEDDPERAVRAAFRALPASASISGDGLPTVRIGIETGPAVVGPIGGGAKVEYGAVGEVVGIAASLQSVARASSVLVGPATRAATEGLFEWGPTEEVARGADAKPLVASYLEMPKARGARRHGHLGGQAPLVGREAQLAVLDSALRETVKGGGAVVVLVGEAGLGKTRLVQECRKHFLAWVGAGTGRLPLWLEGRCASYASSTPYGLYQQLLAAWVDVAPDQGEAVMRPALERALSVVMGNKDLSPLLARMMGLAGGAGLVRLTPEELQRATFSALESLVSRLVAIGPTVLALEDLHWADPTSLRLTTELAGLAQDGPLLVLVTRRPDAGLETSSFERSLATGPVPLRQVELGPLSEEAEEELASSLMGMGASQEVLDVVREGVEGNPLFLEERLHWLVETGALVREQGTWRRVEKVGAEVPEVLERLVRSRVDRLSPLGQEVARTASVLGTELGLGLLTAVCGTEGAVTEEALGPGIAELCNTGLLQEVGRLPEPTYCFRHALIQEATYLGMLRPERRRLHGRAAWALEAMSADRLEQVAAPLGRHFAAAGEPERAVHYFEVAGVHAARTFANDEAISSFRSALAIANEDRSGSEVIARAAAGVWAKLAEVLWRTWRLEEAREAFETAIRLEGPGDALQSAHLRVLLGRLEIHESRHDAALAAFDAAEELLGEQPWDKDDAWADVWLEILLDGRAHLHLLSGEGELALAALTAARPVVEGRGSPARKCEFYWSVAAQRASQNRWRVDEEDIANARKGLAAATQGDDQKDIAYATYAVGHFSLMRGDLVEAREHLEKSLAMAERIGEVALRAQSLWALTETALRSHDVEAVRSLAPQAMASGEAAASPWFVGSAKASLAWLAWQDGRPQGVVALANEAMELWGTAVFDRNQLFGWPLWLCLWPLIAAHLGAGLVGEAVASGRQMLRPSQLRLPDKLESMLESACAAWDQDEPEVARDKMAEAFELARDLRWF